MGSGSYSRANEEKQLGILLKSVKGKLASYSDFMGGVPVSVNVVFNGEFIILESNMTDREFKTHLRGPSKQRGGTMFSGNLDKELVKARKQYLIDELVKRFKPLADASTSKEVVFTYGKGKKLITLLSDMTRTKIEKAVNPLFSMVESQQQQQQLAQKKLLSHVETEVSSLFPVVESQQQQQQSAREASEELLSHAEKVSAESGEKMMFESFKKKIKGVFKRYKRKGDVLEFQYMGSTVSLDVDSEERLFSLFKELSRKEGFFVDDFVNQIENALFVEIEIEKASKVEEVTDSLTEHFKKTFADFRKATDQNLKLHISVAEGKFSLISGSTPDSELKDVLRVWAGAPVANREKFLKDVKGTSGSRKIIYSIAKNREMSC